MAQLTGRAEVFINNIKMGTTEGPTVMFGGEVRETVKGQFKPQGYKVTDVAPGGASMVIAHGPSVDVSDFDVTDATLMLVTDTGSVFLVTQATRVGDPPELDAGAGTISVSLEGQPAKTF